ncbi:T9SS type A sorting domain-containing protein [candidate division GN15 bacterium]|nr:T9SS type A sorting domain-containing protein [candidate division GN15 bacterium]
MTDSVNSDSTYVVSIRLDVTAPILVVQPDTLHFAAALGIDQQQTQSFTVSNGAEGNLTFTVQEGSAWVDVSESGGAAPASVDVSINAVSLSAGDHWAPVAISAPNALSSPDTVWVHVEVVNNVPVVGIEPDSLHLEATNLSQPDTFLTVVNLGAGVLSWTAECDAAWLTLGQSAGVDNGQIPLTINTSLLATGTNSAVVTVTDSAAFNLQQSAVITCEYSVTALDSLVLIGASLDTNQAWALPVEMRLHHGASRIVTPIHYDPDVLTVDSVFPSFALPFFMNSSVQHDPYAGEIRFEFECLNPDTFLAAGVYTLGDIYFMAASQDGYCTLDTFCTATCAEVEFATGESQVPVVLPGLVEVGSPSFDPDSVLISGTTAQVGEVMELPVDLVAVNELRALSVPLEYDPARLTCDSITFDPDWPLYMSRQYQIDSAAGTLRFSTESMADNMYLSPGYHAPVSLWMTVGSFSGVAGISARNDGIESPYVVTSPGIQVRPMVRSGYVQVGATPVDTVRIDAAATAVMSPVSVPVYVTLVSDATRVVLPVGYDPLALTADSVVLGPELPGDIQATVTIDSAQGQVAVMVESMTRNSLVAGEYHWADLYFTAGSQPGETPIDTFANDSIAPIIEGLFGDQRQPQVSGGMVIVSEVTAAEDELPSLVREFTLAQNYPNPFNPATTIAFSLPRRSDTRLTIYNVLGQAASTLIDQTLPAGDHEIIWNGRLDNGQPAPTGVYFYQLVTGQRSLVRKMLLLK